MEFLEWEYSIRIVKFQFLGIWSRTKMQLFSWKYFDGLTMTPVKYFHLLPAIIYCCSVVSGQISGKSWPSLSTNKGAVFDQVRSGLTNDSAEFDSCWVASAGQCFQPISRKLYYTPGRPSGQWESRKLSGDGEINQWEERWEVAGFVINLS